MNSKLKLDIPNVAFDSNLLQLIMQLEVLRNRNYVSNLNPLLFTQVKSIFHMIESLQSARIEGNRTTISDYVVSRFDNNDKKDDIREIQNIEAAINYVNTCYQEDKDFKISCRFLKELHCLITKDLEIEGSKEIGKFRSSNVSIRNAKHIPPDTIYVNEYMEKLVDWINQEDKMQKQLLKVAIAHHCFTWIHPFDNGNGRMSRILTYSMLLQYGFNMAYLLNSTAVFCMDRNKYFDMLQLADENTEEARLTWCEYVINGLNQEMSKVSNLMDKDFFVNKIASPAINKALEFHFINQEHKKILELALEKEDGLIKSKDIQEILKNRTPRQITTLIANMVESRLLLRPEPNSRLYMVNLFSKDLVNGVIDALYKENFIGEKE